MVGPRQQLLLVFDNSAIFWKTKKVKWSAAPLLLKRFWIYSSCSFFQEIRTLRGSGSEQTPILLPDIIIGDLHEKTNKITQIFYFILIKELNFTI